MALKDLLFRCPSCGHFGTVGNGDVARCEECGTEVRRGREAAEFTVKRRGKQASRPLWDLVSRMFDIGGPFPGDPGPDDDGTAGRTDSARVRIRESRREVAVRYKGAVVGFMENLGPAREARLRVTSTALELEWSGTGAEGGARRFDLMDLRALQASSSSLQMYTVDRTLLHIKFLEDSAFRWERMIQELLREAYRQAGMGVIAEFQPRIAVQ